ncbi:hypothetical protein [Haloparvum sp. PAK95]|uniref:hypothetical protein n=1 Tax=Haloparvum sp. PAK95 TaxID=3418962 RepID=UPI003D2F35BD
MGATRNTNVRYPGGRRAAWGALGFIISYVLCLPVAIIRGPQLFKNITVSVQDETFPLSDFVAPDQIAEWVIAGGLFFNAQLVPLSIPIEYNSRSVSVWVNLLIENGGIYLIVLLIPAIVYGITGALATRDEDTTNPIRRAKRAVLQFTGCLPLTVIALYLFSFPVSEMSGGPVLLWGLVIVGFLYPALFGAVGGYIAVKRGM